MHEIVRTSTLIIAVCHASHTNVTVSISCRRACPSNQYYLGIGTGNEEHYLKTLKAFL